MKDLGEVRGALAAFLKAQGLPAVTAWPPADRGGPGRAVCAVSLRGMEAGAPGFQDYLGERYDEARGAWGELYGKKMKLTLGLDLYAATADQAQAGLDLLTAALEGELPAGLRLEEFSAGETCWRESERRFLCPAQARFAVWSYVVAGEDGSFLDFEVEGESV